jgi:activating signal cointegrator complex subunit 3
LYGASFNPKEAIAAELAICASLRDCPLKKVVFISPAEDLACIKFNEWNTRLMPLMGKTVVKLNGNAQFDLKAIQKANLIVTTPRNWHAATCRWKPQKYLAEVSCVIIDEIQLLGDDSKDGHIIEFILSRVNFICSRCTSLEPKGKIRIIGLGSALANPLDIAVWICVENFALFNFARALRPVPLEIYIHGYSGKNCNVVSRYSSLCR